MQNRLRIEIIRFGVVVVFLKVLMFLLVMMQFMNSYASKNVIEITTTYEHRISDEEAFDFLWGSVGVLFLQEGCWHRLFNQYFVPNGVTRGNLFPIKCNF